MYGVGYDECMNLAYFVHLEVRIFLLRRKIFFLGKKGIQFLTSKMRGIGKVMSKVPIFMNNDSSSESSYHSDDDVVVDVDMDMDELDVVRPSSSSLTEVVDKIPSKKEQARMKKYENDLKEFGNKYVTLCEDERSAFTLKFASEHPLKRSRVKKAGKIKKKRLSAFNVFFSQKLKELKEDGRGGVNNTERLTMVGQLWNNLSDKDRSEYQRVATEKNMANDPTYEVNTIKKEVKAKTPEQLFMKWLKDSMIGMPEFAGLRGKELHRMALKEAKKEEYNEKKREFYHNY